jgi:hypothetical protein
VARNVAHSGQWHDDHVVSADLTAWNQDPELLGWLATL